MKKFVVLIMLLILLASGCTGKNGSIETVGPVEQPAITDGTPEILPEPTEICGFCGRDIPAGSALARPLLVIYGNTREARPQSGLAEACFVYEVPVEGGLTRLLALFSHQFAGEIGPIRSARPYFAVLTLEHGGILAHCGFSPRGQIVLRQLNVAHINEIAYGDYYYRSKDRKAPHNLYSNITLLQKGAERLKYLPGKGKEPVFKTGSLLGSVGEEARNVKIAFSTSLNIEYVLKDGSYLRSINGQAHEDRGGEQLRAKNLVVQFINVKPEEPGSERLDITLTGQGNGLYFVDGRAFPLLWTKKDEASPTRYTVNDREVLFEPGQTWIHLVPTRVQNSVTFE